MELSNALGPRLAISAVLCFALMMAGLGYAPPWVGRLVRTPGVRALLMVIVAIVGRIGWAAFSGGNSSSRAKAAADAAVASTSKKTAARPPKAD